jgi:hypothetical protein
LFVRFPLSFFLAIFDNFLGMGKLFVFLFAISSKQPVLFYFANLCLGCLRPTLSRFMQYRSHYIPQEYLRRATETISFEISSFHFDRTQGERAQVLIYMHVFVWSGNESAQSEEFFREGERIRKFFPEGFRRAQGRQDTRRCNRCDG